MRRGKSGRSGRETSKSGCRGKKGAGARRRGAVRAAAVAGGGLGDVAPGGHADRASAETGARLDARWLSC